MSATPSPTIQSLTLVDDYLGPARVRSVEGANPRSPQNLLRTPQRSKLRYSMP